MTSHARMKRWGVIGACVATGVMLAACTRGPRATSASVFNYSDRALAYVLINGANAGYKLAGEGGGSTCCSAWPDTPEVLVEWQYDRPKGTPEKPSDFVKKQLKVPTLPDCWKPGMAVYLVAHVFPDQTVQLETLVERAPWSLTIKRKVPLNAALCEISKLGERA